MMDLMAQALGDLLRESRSLRVVRASAEWTGAQQRLLIDAYRGSKSNSIMIFNIGTKMTVAVHNLLEDAHEEKRRLFGRTTR